MSQWTCRCAVCLTNGFVILIAEQTQLLDAPDSQRILSGLFAGQSDVHWVPAIDAHLAALQGQGHRQCAAEMVAGPGAQTGATVWRHGFDSGCGGDRCGHNLHQEAANAFDAILVFKLLQCTH